MRKTARETVTPVDPIISLNRLHQTVSEKFRDQSVVLCALFMDIARHFPNFVVDDFQYLIDRINKEGDSFCLNTLPIMGKALEVSLITREAFKCPDGWKLKKTTRLPKFCFELFSQLFSESGVPHEIVKEHSTSACLYLRQLFLMWSKVRCAQLPQTGAVDEFQRRIIRKSTTLNVDSQILNEARRLIRVVLEDKHHDLPDLRDFEKNPWGRHGPGAVSGREVGAEKWDFSIWPGLTPKLFRWNSNHKVKTGCFDKQPPARVCIVPKDFRGPRIICIEPKENQFAQQGLMDILYTRLARHPLSGRSIDFSNTEVSRRMCYDNTLATIDLKDASDNLSLHLGKLLLPRWFYLLVTKYRSRFISINGTLVQSTCLATMGNATCFPLQTLIFWAITLGTLIVVRDSLGYAGRKLKLTTRVFGDDIITPVWGADAVCDALASCGLVINKSKTCVDSLVRESCGEWVYNGEAIRIARFLYTGVRDHLSYLSFRDVSNDVLRGQLPSMKVAVDTLCDDFIGEPRKRFNRNLQRLEKLVPTFVQRGVRRELCDYTGLYAWHVAADRTPFLKGARKRVKMRWVNSESC